MAVVSNSSSKTRRRWLRFSLRTLFVAVMALCLWCGFYLAPAKRQQRATEALERVGVQIHYDYQRQQSESTAYSLKVSPPGPRAARWLLGEDFFQTATWISLANRSIKADDLRPVRELPLLHEVCLTNCGISDEHMASIGDLRMVTSIILSHNIITDAGLSNLSQLTDLESLELSGNQITGTGIGTLAALKKLRHLGLHDNPVSDGALVHLTGFRRLQSLALGNSRITNEGLKLLVSLTSLRYLGLSGTYVTKAAVKDLQESLPSCKIESYNLRQQ